MLREATYPPAAVNVLDVSSESMAAFQVFLYGRFWVFTEVNATKIASLRHQGLSWAEITRETGISKGTAQRALAGLPKTS
jgi:hypothetical protein